MSGERTPRGTDAAEFDRDLFAARDRSIESMRQVADPKLVEKLAHIVHDVLQGFSQADGLLALARVLGVFLSRLSPAERITGIAIISTLVADEMLRAERIFRQ